MPNNRTVLQETLQWVCHHFLHARKHRGKSREKDGDLQDPSRWIQSSTDNRESWTSLIWGSKLRQLHAPVDEHCVVRALKWWSTHLRVSRRLDAKHAKFLSVRFHCWTRFWVDDHHLIEQNAHTPNIQGLVMTTSLSHEQPAWPNWLWGVSFWHFQVWQARFSRLHIAPESSRERDNPSCHRT